MDTSSAHRKLTDRGIASVQFILASALALILFLALANLVVVQYGRGAIRSALDQGVRAGAVSGSAADCEHQSLTVLGQLLGGRMSREIVVTCGRDGRLMVAHATARFESWTPLSSDFDLRLTSEAMVEPSR